MNIHASRGYRNTVIEDRPMKPGYVMRIGKDISVGDEAGNFAGNGPGARTKLLNLEQGLPVRDEGGFYGIDHVYREATKYRVVCEQMRALPASSQEQLGEPGLASVHICFALSDCFMRS